MESKNELEKKIWEVLQEQGENVSKDTVNRLANLACGFYEWVDIEYHTLPHDTDLSPEQIRRGAEVHVMAKLAEMGRTLTTHPQVVFKYGREDEPQTPTKFAIKTYSRPLADKPYDGE